VTLWRIRQHQMHSLLTPGSATDTDSVALPSYVPHVTVMYSRRGFAIQHVKHCIEGSTVAVFISMGCQPSAACVASASFRSPAFFCTKESSDCP